MWPDPPTGQGLVPVHGPGAGDPYDLDNYATCSFLEVERSLENPEHLVLTRVKNGVLWLTVFCQFEYVLCRTCWGIASSFCEAILFYICFPQIMIYLIDKVIKAILSPISGHYPWIWPSLPRPLLETESPELSQHLDTLQKTANKESGGSDDSMLFTFENSYFSDTTVPMEPKP